MHEMLYGYAAAIVTGFLLTAIPNWTGRLPLKGVPLLILLLTWVAGRLAVSFSAVIGWAPAAVVDAVFLTLVVLAAGREIVAGQNWRNLRVLAIVTVFAAANIGFHIEAHYRGFAPYSLRVGLSAAILLVMLIGGRIIPSFTRNWLAQRSPGRMPDPFGRWDFLSLGIAMVALALWIVQPSWVTTSAALLLAGVMHAQRLARWAGDRTWLNPLVLILHIGYAFVPAGFLLLGAVSLNPEIIQVAPSAGVHAWSAGAIGVMTLAVMTRASRGHTGRPLTAPFTTVLLYLAAIAAAVLRILAAFLPESSEALLWASAVAWVGAFWGFCLLYGPMLLRPRLTAREPAPPQPS
jgi:uncharacterized protein involved in response to NO